LVSILSFGSKERMGLDVFWAKTVEVAIGRPGPSVPECWLSIMMLEDVDIADLSQFDSKMVKTSHRRVNLRSRELKYSPIRFA